MALLLSERSAEYRRAMGIAGCSLFLYERGSENRMSSSSSLTLQETSLSYP